MILLQPHPDVYSNKTGKMSLLSSKVLVLNSSYEPLRICDAQKAVLLLFGGKAVPVAHHPEKAICTVSCCFPLPSIIRLNVFVRVPFKKIMLNKKHSQKGCVPLSVLRKN